MYSRHVNSVDYMIVTMDVKIDAKYEISLKESTQINETVQSPITSTTMYCR